MLHLSWKSSLCAAALAAVVGFTGSARAQQPTPADGSVLSGDVTYAEPPVMDDDTYNGGTVMSEGVVMSEGMPESAGSYPAYGSPYRADLFYNYYLPPSPYGVGASMYLAPKPVPAWVGHTYYTYQPFLPHEYMYRHHRRYTRTYNGGLNHTTTRVHYGSTFFR